MALSSLKCDQERATVATLRLPPRTSHAMDRSTIGRDRGGEVVDLEVVGSEPAHQGITGLLSFQA